MADHTTYSTHTKETRSSGALAFIVGALVVAVAVLAYFIFGDGFGQTGSSASAPAIEITTNADSAAGASDDGASAGAESGASYGSGAEAGAAADATAGN